MKMTVDLELAKEVKALVALAFRNGPIEELHAGNPCPACSGKAEISHISDEEMKNLMKSAVIALYRLLWLRDHDRQSYEKQIAFGHRYTAHWDDPEISQATNSEARLG